MQDVIGCFISYQFFVLYTMFIWMNTSESVFFGNGLNIAIGYLFGNFRESLDLLIALRNKKSSEVCGSKQMPLTDSKLTNAA